MPQHTSPAAAAHCESLEHTFTAALTGAQYVCVLASEVRTQASPMAVLHSESLEHAFGQPPVVQSFVPPKSQQALGVPPPPPVPPGPGKATPTQSLSVLQEVGHVSAQNPTSGCEAVWLLEQPPDVAIAATIVSPIPPAPSPPVKYFMATE